MMGFATLNPSYRSRLRQGDDNIQDPDTYHGSAAAACIQSEGPRCLCGDASEPGSDALPSHGPHLYPGRSLAGDGHVHRGMALRGYGMWACEKIDDGAFVETVGIFQPLDWP